MPETKSVVGWKLRRSGASMTLTGENGFGAPVRVPDVKIVNVEGDQVLATTKSGETYVLRVPVPRAA